MTGFEYAALIALSLVMGAQGIGKLLDIKLYAAALGRFRAFSPKHLNGVAIAWTSTELVACICLGLSAINMNPLVFKIGAVAAFLDALSYTILTVGTKLRGIEIANCTCFGVHLPQRLSIWVIIQDFVMLTWTAWILFKAL